MMIFEDLVGLEQRKLKNHRFKSTENLVSTNTTSEIDLKSVKQASKDSVRAIMLIRAYRIRGHLIANLDPLSIQKKEEHPELVPETYGFSKKDFNRKIFLDGVLGLQYADLNQILKILKKLTVQILVMNLCTWVIRRKKLG